MTNVGVNGFMKKTKVLRRVLLVHYDVEVFSRLKMTVLIVGIQSSRFGNYFLNEKTIVANTYRFFTTFWQLLAYPKSACF